MKICAIICEYNPFHNGHLHHIQAAKARSGADTILCLMSGNFVQRGETAILDKYTRAQHAVLAGADIVLELPTVFATANAEIFAKGAISILSSIPVDILSFGAENADKTVFRLAAKYLSDEPKIVSQKIKENVSRGESYAKARAQAFAGFVPYDLLSSPNNILGLEYTKAILQSEANIDILPIPRIDNGYRDTSLSGEFASATAIRTAIESKARTKIKEYLPHFVYKSLPTTTKNSLSQLEKTAILTKGKEELVSTLDCTEGLEHAFYRASKENANLVETLTSMRYTSSRIRRIALQNLLGIKEDLIRNALEKPLYLSPLACKKERTDVLSFLGNCDLTFLSHGNKIPTLNETARKCLDIDLFAESVYAIATDAPLKEKKNIMI